MGCKMAITKDSMKIVIGNMGGLGRGVCYILDMKKITIKYCNDISSRVSAIAITPNDKLVLVGCLIIGVL